AIIDTGSQLNIVHHKVWTEAINLPMNKEAGTTMNDANGGKGELSGLVENVPLRYGSVALPGDLFVGKHVPFALLLGRPWQKRNFVSIDERLQGTYLVIKDP
ncbi:hypothetical protein BV25DRAFT_1777975, partial [Artomyces pyxidatus]